MLNEVIDEHFSKKKKSATFICANTIKGKGIKFAESSSFDNSLELYPHHAGAMTPDDYEKALDILIDAHEKLCTKLKVNIPNNPFPEEINRKLIAQLATFHFAPTEKNKNDLQKEGINNNVWVVGNTVIDALNHTLKIVKNGFRPPFEIKKEKNSKLILVTGHRRESVGEPFTNLCNQLSEIATHDKSIQILFSFEIIA